MKKDLVGESRVDDKRAEIGAIATLATANLLW